tara:strand:- start:226 stop:357 length:132 start_codon:yes stop_codon:yes gene_type:complete
MDDAPMIHTCEAVIIFMLGSAIVWMGALVIWAAVQRRKWQEEK